MSYADLVFKNMCQDILKNGTDTSGEAVRPHWPDGTAAYTIKKFGDASTTLTIWSPSFSPSPIISI